MRAKKKATKREVAASKTKTVTRKSTPAPQAKKASQTKKAPQPKKAPQTKKAAKPARKKQAAKIARAKPAKKVATKKSPAKPAKASASANKTQANSASVQKFVASIDNAQRRADAERALALMGQWTGLQPKMWGPSIIGYGSYHYRYESGREGDMCMAGFSPRSSALVFYLTGGARPGDPLFSALGKHKLGGSCLYVNKLSEIDISVLEKLVRQSIAYMRQTYPITD